MTMNRQLAKEVAKRLHDLDRRVADLARKPQLGDSSIEGGSIDEYTEDGQLASIIGAQPDGTHTVASVVGPVPPVPVAAQCSTVPGLLQARWNGKFVADAVSPMDLKHVGVQVIAAGEDVADLTTQKATIRGELGDVANIQLAPGVYTVYLRAWSQSGKYSAPSVGVQVTVPVALDQASVDAALTDLDERTDGLTVTAGQLDTRLGTAEADLTAHNTRITDAETDLTTAFGQISTAQSSANSAQSTATAAQTAASNAQIAADDAAADAAAAAGIANGKGKVLAQSTAPAAADQNAVTLWIDTTGGANTPKRWNGSAWVAVTDKAATDAAAAAVAAQNTANAAQTAAGNAQSTADGAMTMAVSKSKVYYSTLAPSGSGTATGDLWRQRNGTNEVIGEWQWSGTAWVSQTVSGSIVSNMDIGFLTAGSAVMSQALINKLVAGTANFQTVDVKNLFVTTGSFTEAVINRLWADIFIAHKITVKELAVGSFDNLIADPLIQDHGDWSGTTPSVTKYTDQGRWGGGSILVASSATQVGSYYGLNTPDKRTRMEPGRTYRITMQARGSADIPVGGVGLYLRLYDAANTGFVFLTPANYNNTAVIPASTWGTVTGTFTIPEDTMYVYGVVGMYKQTAYTTGSVRFSNPNVTLMADGVLVVDGSITAASLAADAINGKVITGAVFQTSALAETGIKIDTAGFRAYGPNGGDPVVEILPDGAKTIGVTDPATGDALATLGSDGTVSGVGLNIETDPILMGQPLFGNFAGYTSPNDQVVDGVLDIFPRGVVAYGVGNRQNVIMSGVGELAIMELGFDSLPGRAYRVSTTPMSVIINGPGNVYFNVRRTTDGTKPRLTSGKIYGKIYGGMSEGAPDRHIVNMGGDFIIMAGFSGRQRLLFSWYVDEANTAARIVDYADGAELRVVVEDIGPNVPDSGIARTDSLIAAVETQPTPPPEVKNYTKVYTPVSFRNYMGNGNQYTGGTSGKVYQGQSPYGPNGVLSSIQTFPSFTGDLSGATITSIRAYFYFDHWYYNSGGTADIMLHGQSSLPSTKPSLTNARNISGWPKPGGMWFNIPSSYWAGFKSGTYKGVGLGDGTSGYTHYGYANASKTRIEIKYTK